MRRAGLALAAVGAVDIGSCISAIASGQSYSSSLNVFALIAGILVYKGQPGAARFVVKGLSFLLGAFLLIPVLAVAILPMMRAMIPPPRLLWREMADSPLETALGVVVSTGTIGLLVWIRKTLAALPLFEGRPAPAFFRTPATAMGAAIPLVLAILWRVLVPADVGERAIQEARRKVGPGYSFYVREFNGGPGHGKAIVVAYSDTETREVAVQWNDP